MSVKCPFQKYESEYSSHEKGQFMDCYEENCMAYRPKKELAGGERHSRLAVGSLTNMLSTLRRSITTTHYK